MYLLTLQRHHGHIELVVERKILTQEKLKMIGCTTIAVQTRPALFVKAQHSITYEIVTGYSGVVLWDISSQDKLGKNQLCSDGMFCLVNIRQEDHWKKSHKCMTDGW
ncbi:hypothetical protein XENTR_v10009447 [Xenopus tropicalis]|nr:hypothetical protein XENTR_v10009447 [Xenopus tropicalis]